MSIAAAILKYLYKVENRDYGLNAAEFLYAQVKFLHLAHDAGNKFINSICYKLYYIIYLFVKQEYR